MVYPTAKYLLLPIFRLFVKEVEGIDNLPRKGPFIIAANHSSFLDPLVLAGVVIPVVDQKIHFFAKPVGIWKLFTDYISISWAGCIPVEKTRHFHKKSLNAATGVLKAEGVVGIFPEGTRNFGVLLKGHKGVAVLAAEGFPIVPIGITGAHETWPKNKTFPRLKRIIKIRIGKPMKFKKVYKGRIEQAILEKMTRKIMRRIGELINQEYGW